jgi:hypothetical protein
MSGILKTGGDGKTMISFPDERTSGQVFRKQLRSGCDQNGMGWAITVGHAMNQFLIHIALENMIETSGVLLTCKLTMIKSRTTSLGTNFSDYKKMRLASEEDLDDLIEAIDKEYLIQVNR